MVMVSYPANLHKREASLGSRQHPQIQFRFVLRNFPYKRKIHTSGWVAKYMRLVTAKKEQIVKRGRYYKTTVLEISILGEPDSLQASAAQKQNKNKNGVDRALIQKLLRRALKCRFLLRCRKKVKGIQSMLF